MGWEFFGGKKDGISKTETILSKIASDPDLHFGKQVDIENLDLLNSLKEVVATAKNGEIDEAKAKLAELHTSVLAVLPPDGSLGQQFSEIFDGVEDDIHALEGDSYREAA